MQKATYSVGVIYTPLHVAIELDFSMEKVEMSEQQNQLEQDAPLVPGSADADWFLRMVVKIVTEIDIGIPITCSVGGLLVSGELVSGQQYFEDFGKDLTKGFINSGIDIGNGIAEVLKKMGDSVYKNTSKEEETEPSEPSYIHLKNVKFFHPAGQPIPSNQGSWWRGRLQAVDGFVLGSLSYDQDQ